MLLREYLQLVNDLQHIVTVCIGFDLAKDVRDAALLVNHEGRTQHAVYRFAVHHLFAPRAVLFHHRVIGVRQQRKGQVVFLAEFLMRRLSVGADAEDDDVAFGGFGICVAEPARFFRSARRVVSRVKVQHDFVAFEIGQFDGLARRIFQVEGRRFAADFEFCGHSLS